MMNACQCRHMGRGKTTRALEAYARQTPMEQEIVARAKRRLAPMKSRPPIQQVMTGPLAGISRGQVNTPLGALGVPVGIAAMLEPVGTATVVGSILGLVAAVKGIQHIKNKIKREAIKSEAIKEIDSLREAIARLETPSEQRVYNPLDDLATLTPAGRGMKPKRKPSAHAMRVREIMKQNPGMKLGEASKLASSQRS